MTIVCKPNTNAPIYIHAYHLGFICEYTLTYMYKKRKMNCNCNNFIWVIDIKAFQSYVWSSRWVGVENIYGFSKHLLFGGGVGGEAGIDHRSRHLCTQHRGFWLRFDTCFHWQGLVGNKKIIFIVQVHVILENVKNGRIPACWLEFPFTLSLSFKVYDLETKINFLGTNIAHMKCPTFPGANVSNLCFRDSSS